MKSQSFSCNFILFIVTFAVAAAILSSTARADFDAGVKAYEAKDYKTAFNQWLAAANGSDAKAQYRLGQLYEAGDGTIQNFAEAHRWYNLAASGGVTEAKAARDAVAAKMSHDELAAARKLAAEWKPTIATSEGAPTPPTSSAAAAAAISPDQAIAHFKVGFDALKNKDYDKAIKEFKAGIAIKDDAQAEFYLGEGYRLKGDSAAARSAYRRSAALDPKSEVAKRSQAADRALSQTAVTPSRGANDGREANNDFFKLLADRRIYAYSISDRSELASICYRKHPETVAFSVKSNRLFEYHKEDLGIPHETLQVRPDSIIYIDGDGSKLTLTAFRDPKLSEFGMSENAIQMEIVPKQHPDWHEYYYGVRCLQK
jgi:TPR repeat protein